MSTGQDEPSPSLNGRLRPRKSTRTPNLQNKTTRKEDKLAPDRPKRSSAPSKASSAKQHDLVDKIDSAPAPTAPAPAAPAPAATTAPTALLCPYCDRKFYTRQSASKHARRIHLSTSKQDNFIKCLYCNHSDADSNAIIKHMVDSHPNQYFTCMDCHTRFPSTAELADHKNTVCEKQKPAYRSKLRQKTSTGVKNNPKRTINKGKIENSDENLQFSDNLTFNGIVISCELKPTDMHDAADIEDKITTNLILPSSKTLSNTSVDKNAVIVLDDFQWNKRIPPNFSFHSSDADQILSRLGVVHRSPRVGESRKDLIKLSDEQNEKFEKCFDTSFYSKVAKNVQDNLANYLDGTFNFNPNKDIIVKTRKSKASVTINTSEGFPILLASEQVSRHLCDGFIPRTMAPKHKWKWDTAENDKNLLMLLDQTKRDNHSNNCIISLISSLDIWTQLRMKGKFEEIVKITPNAKKMEKQNIISLELKEILESRDIPSTSTHVMPFKTKPAEVDAGSELTTYLGLVPSSGTHELQPAVLSGEWVRPRCYVCCACGDQTRDARTLAAHVATQHPHAQVEHYEIVGETLLSADILKHLYVPPSQMSNRTRPPRGFRDCTKCKKSVTLEDLHQHMLDCAGDTPTVRRKCRYRPFGVRRRRPRLPDNTIRKKIRKDIRSRHRQKAHIRPRPRIRTEVGDAETIRKMIADLPAKRNRLTPTNNSRPRRAGVIKPKKQIKLRHSEDIKSKHRPVRNLNKANKSDVVNKQSEAHNSTASQNSLAIDEDDQPLKLSSTHSTRADNANEGFRNLRKKTLLNKPKKKKQSQKQDTNMDRRLPHYYYRNSTHDDFNPRDQPMTHFDSSGLPIQRSVSLNNVLRPTAYRLQEYPPCPPYCFPNTALAVDLEFQNRAGREQLYFEAANAETARIIHQSALQSGHQPFNVENAGPSNARQNSSRNENNSRRRNDHSKRRQSRNNKNKGTAKTPNLPLKHSIASLTSNSDDRDASTSYHESSVLPETNAKVVSDSAGSRTEFENEIIVEEVDKPPIANNSTESINLPSTPNISTESINLSSTSNNSTESINVPSTSNDSTESINAPSTSNNSTESKNLPSTSNNSTGSINLPSTSTDREENYQPPPQVSEITTNDGNTECRRILSPADEIMERLTTNEETTAAQRFKVSNEYYEQLTIQDESPELVEIDPNHKLTQRTTDGKIVPDKFKGNRVKRGLNDCIAMLRSIKGMEGDADDIDVVSVHPIPRTRQSEKPTTVNSAGSIIINTEVPTTVNSDTSLSLSENNGETDSEGLKTENSDMSISLSKIVDENIEASENLALVPSSSGSISEEDILDNDIDISSNPSYTDSPISEENIDNKAKAVLDLSNNINKTENIVDNSLKVILESSKGTRKKVEEKTGPNLATSSPFSGLDAGTTLSENQFTCNELQANNVGEHKNTCIDSKQALPNIQGESNEMISSSKNKSEVIIQNESVRATKIEYSSNSPVSSEYNLELSGNTANENFNLSRFQSIWHDTHGRLPTHDEIESCFYRNIINQTEKGPEDIHNSNLTQAMANSQENLLMRTNGDCDYSDHNVVERQRPQSTSDSTFMIDKTDATATLVSKDLLTSSEKAVAAAKQMFSETRMSSRQSDVSTAQKNTNKKSSKTKINTEQQMEYNSEQSTSLKHALVSPQHHDSRGIGASPIDTNMRHHNSYFPVITPSHESLLLRTPPPMPPLTSNRIRRESCKRDLNAPETAIENRDNINYLPKTAGTSQDLYPLYYPHSFYNPHDNVYLNEQSVVNTAQTAHTYDELNELHGRYSSDSPFMPIVQESHGGSPKPLKCSDIRSISRIAQESYHNTNENEYHGYIERSDNIKTRSDDLMQGVKHVDKYTSQENNDFKKKSKPINRRSSDMYYTHSSPYQRSVPNIKTVEHSLNKCIDEHTESYEGHYYQDSVALSAAPIEPKTTYPGNHLQISTMSAPQVPVMQPLDLSWARDREVPRFELDLSLKTSSEVTKGTAKISKSNENHLLNVCTRTNIRSSNTENPPLNSYLSSRGEQVEEPAHPQPLNVTVQKTEQKLKQDANFQDCTQRCQPTPVENSKIAQIPTPANTALNNSNINNNFTNAGNPDNQPSSSIFPFLSTQVDEKGKTLLQSDATYHENKKGKIDYKTSKTKKKVGTKFEEATAKSKHVVSTLTNINTHQSLHDSFVPHSAMTDHTFSVPGSEANMISPEISISSNDIDMSTDLILDIVSKEMNGPMSNRDTIPENDKTQIEQDAETARKIAMLPEELVKILGTIPKDHRNQLLNVLPQYISTPLYNVENHVNTTTNMDNVKKKDQSPSELRKTNSTGNDPNLLSVKSVVSPSSVIPKKRHSPSLSKERLKSTELQTTEPIFPSPFAPLLPQRSSVKHNETMDFKCSQNECLINDSESKVVVPTVKTSEKNKDNTVIPNQSELAHTNKSNDLPALGEKAYFPSITTHDSQSFKPPMKPMKQKSFNEQTASLRAVRIKSTSAKKSFSEENKLLTGYHKTSLKVDKSGQNINSGHKICNINPTDLKYKLANSQNIQVNCDTCDATEHVEMANNEKDEKNINFNDTVPPYSEVQNNETIVILKNADNLTNTNPLQKPLPLIPSEKSDMAVEQLSDETQLKTSTVEKQAYDKVYVVEQKHISENEMDKSLSDTLSQSDSNKDDIFKFKVENITNKHLDKKIATIFNDIINEVPSFSTTDFRDNEYLQENNLENQINSKKSMACLKNQANKNESLISKEDESDDDVTLAVIKLQHSEIDKQKNKKRIAKPARISSKLKKKNKRKFIQSEKSKKEKSRSNKNIRIESDVFSSSDDIVQATGTNVQCNDGQNLAVVLPVCKVPVIVSQFESDVTENLNLGSKNLDVNSFSGMENKQTQNKEILINNNLKENYIQPNSEVTQGSRETIDSRNLEFDNLSVSTNESNSKTKKRNSNKSESKLCKSNIDVKGEFDLCSTLNKKEEVLKDSKTDSTEITTFSKLLDGTQSDFQLCSEISEVNTLPLRRSRRGKSMYVDSTYLEDSDHIEDSTKKTPLTMKRLILSRVEKDKKRNSETKNLEMSCDTVIHRISNNCEEEEITPGNKEKTLKRKKSPHIKRISKKNKPANAHEHDDEEEDISDFSISNISVENNICILRELPNAENKISEKDDVKSRAMPDTTCLSKITAKVSNEKESNVAGDCLTDVRETATSAKRKVNTKLCEAVSSKSKKSRYQKKKAQSDFDSDDDKVLLETKQKKSMEKHLVNDYQSGNNTLKDDIVDKSPNIVYEASSEESKLPSVSIESRVTCYSKFVSNKKPRSSSCNEYVNYDPYDFDLIDMVETTGPIIKKKSKNSGQSVKVHRSDKVNVTRYEINESPKTSEKNETLINVQPITNNESDSDSSKSDIPLQKYVDEKASKVDLQIKNNTTDDELADIIENTDNMEPSLKCIHTKTAVVTDNISYNFDDKISDNLQLTETSKNKKHTKGVSSHDTLLKTDSPVDNVSKNANNNNTDDQTARKRSIKHKKNRRTPTTRNVDSHIASNDMEQQLQSDKFLENFGFYSERIPRKSNLLAAKKISETFYMICNENEDSLFGSKEKPSRKSVSNESKKKIETESNTITLQDTKKKTCDQNNDVQSAEPIIEIHSKKVEETTEESLLDKSNPDTTEVDSDLSFSFLFEAKEDAPKECFEGFPKTDSINKDTNDTNTPTFNCTSQEDNFNSEIIKKSTKRKQIKEPGIKDKMYPDIEEIDMFEDKFDKIKRKRRSQAVAAKQVQVAAETNASFKSRKLSEKKKSTKTTKKNYQSTVLTKGALKGFEGIKISIPTHDLNMPINVSPPKQSKKRRKATVRRKKGINDSDSSGSDDEKDTSGLDKDIYEFKDSEDAELFDLRPSTVMDRFRSMHNKYKFKPKDKRDTEKERNKNRDKERKIGIKESLNFEKDIDHIKHITKDNEQRHTKRVSREYESDLQVDFERETNYSERNFENHMNEDTVKPNNTDCGVRIDVDKAVASTSSFYSNRVEESDYESGMSSPEGDFMFYMSNDINCVCPSDNDSDDSDVERGCGRVNCTNKIRNADKNAAIENIFKNNAVRCEKPETKEPEKAKPNLDQLFDSLLETETKSNNNDMSKNQIHGRSSNIDLKRNNLSEPSSLEMQHSLTESCHADMISLFDRNSRSDDLHQHETTNRKTENKGNSTDKSVQEQSHEEDTMSDWNSLGIDKIQKPKDIGYSLMSEESTQVNFSDIMGSQDSIAQSSDMNDKRGAKLKEMKPLVSNSNSEEDEFDIDKPETLKRQFMHLILPAEKVSTHSQTECDVLDVNELPTAAISIEAVVSTQNAQTGKTKRHENDPLRRENFSKSKVHDVRDSDIASNNRIRSREMSQESKPKKSIRKEKNKSYRSYQYDIQSGSDDDFINEKICDRVVKDPDTNDTNIKKKSNAALQNDNDTTTPELVDAFTAPTSRIVLDKRSPRKSDEGISTSLDYSADQSDQSFNDAGVARQRARRKCTVGKQNVLVEHWSSESEFDGGPPRPNSADSVINPPRKKKSRKRESHHTGGRKARHSSKSDSKSLKGREHRVASEDSDTGAGGSGGPARPPPGPKIRARAAQHYWSSEGEDAAGPQPQHGWIVGDSHKKLVTMLAHAKGRKRNNADKHLD